MSFTSLAPTKHAGDRNFKCSIPPSFRESKTSLEKCDKNNILFVAGDIDPEFNVVEITEEAKAELAKIENKIGDFICRLCKEVYDDAFGLAQHR